MKGVYPTEEAAASCSIEREEREREREIWFRKQNVGLTLFNNLCGCLLHRFNKSDQVVLDIVLRVALPESERHTHET